MTEPADPIARLREKWRLEQEQPPPPVPQRNLIYLAGAGALVIGIVLAFVISDAFDSGRHLLPAAARTTTSSSATAAASAPVTDFKAGRAIVTALNRGGYRCRKPERVPLAGAREAWRCSHSRPDDTAAAVFAGHRQLASFLRRANKRLVVSGTSWAVLVTSPVDAAKVRRILPPP